MQTMEWQKRLKDLRDLVFTDPAQHSKTPEVLAGYLTAGIPVSERQQFLQDTLAYKFERRKEAPQSFAMEDRALNERNSFFQAVDVAIEEIRLTNQGRAVELAGPKKTVADDYNKAWNEHVKVFAKQKEQIRSLADKIWDVVKNAGHLPLFGNMHAEGVIAKLVDIQARCKELLGSDANFDDKLLKQLFPGESQRNTFLREVFSAFEGNRLTDYFKNNTQPDVLRDFFMFWQETARASVATVEVADQSKVTATLAALGNSFPPVVTVAPVSPAPALSQPPVEKPPTVVAAAAASTAPAPAAAPRLEDMSWGQISGLILSYHDSIREAGVQESKSQTHQLSSAGNYLNAVDLGQLNNLLATMLGKMQDAKLPPEACALELVFLATELAKEKEIGVAVKDAERDFALSNVNSQTWYDLLCKTELTDDDRASMTEFIKADTNKFTEILKANYSANVKDEAGFFETLKNIEKFGNDGLKDELVKLAVLADHITAAGLSASYSSGGVTYAEALALAKKSSSKEQLNFHLTILEQTTGDARKEVLKEVLNDLSKLLEEHPKLMDTLLSSNINVAQPLLYKILASEDSVLRKYVIERLEASDSGLYRAAVIGIMQDFQSKGVEVGSRFLQGVAGESKIANYSAEQSGVIFSAFKNYLDPKVAGAADTINNAFSGAVFGSSPQAAQNATDFFRGALVECNVEAFHKRIAYELTDMKASSVCLQALSTMAKANPQLASQKEFDGFLQRRLDIGQELKGQNIIVQASTLGNEIVANMDHALGSSSDNVKFLAEAVAKGGVDSPAYKYITGDKSSKETCQNDITRLRVMDAVLSSRDRYEGKINKDVVAGLNAAENKMIGIGERILLGIKRLVGRGPASDEGYKAPGIDIKGASMLDAAGQGSGKQVLDAFGVGKADVLAQSAAATAKQLESKGAPKTVITQSVVPDSNSNSDATGLADVKTAPKSFNP